MLPTLLLIDNHDSFTYNLVDLLRTLAISYQVVEVDRLTLNQVSEFSHILISPGPDVPRAYPKLFTILEKYHRSKSILGVCLGHQTLCEFFGATLYNLPQVRHGQAGQLVRQVDSALFANLPSQFQVGLYHSWAVSTVNFPAELQITALDQQGVIMAMQHRTLPIFGVQFHPESYISAFGQQILTNWLTI